MGACGGGGGDRGRRRVSTERCRTPVRPRARAAVCLLHPKVNIHHQTHAEDARARRRRVQLQREGSAGRAVKPIVSGSLRYLAEVLSARPTVASVSVSSLTPPPHCHSLAAPQLILATIRARQAPPRTPLDLQDTKTEAKSRVLRDQAGGRYPCCDRLSSPVCAALRRACLVATRYTHSRAARVWARVAGPFAEVAAASSPSRRPSSGPARRAPSH